MDASGAPDANIGCPHASTVDCPWPAGVDHSHKAFAHERGGCLSTRGMGRPDTPGPQRPRGGVTAQGRQVFRAPAGVLGDPLLRRRRPAPPAPPAQRLPHPRRGPYRAHRAAARCPAWAAAPSAGHAERAGRCVPGAVRRGAVERGVVELQPALIAGTVRIAAYWRSVGAGDWDLAVLAAGGAAVPGASRAASGAAGGGALEVDR